METEAAEKQAKFDKEAAIKEAADEKAKKEVETVAAAKNAIAGQERILKDKEEAEKVTAPFDKQPLTADEHWTANELGSKFISEAQKTSIA